MYVPVVGHPVEGGVEVADCASSIHNTSGGTVIVNPTPGCDCWIQSSLAHGEPAAASDTFEPCEPIAIRKTTWGSIKTLYEE